MVVFADSYLIILFKEQAEDTIKDKLTDHYQGPFDMFAAIEVLAAFDIAFGNLPEKDPLLKWLAAYAAYKLKDHQKLQEQFQVSC